MRVLIIPEDFRNDQYLLRPLFDRLFRSLDIPANVAVCQDPLLGGVHEALKSERLQEIIDRYDAMTDLFILCVDRDGNLSRRNRLDQIEAEFDGQRRFLAENAWEELETWTLAGLSLPNDWRLGRGTGRGVREGALFRAVYPTAWGYRRSRSGTHAIGRRGRAPHCDDSSEVPGGLRPACSTNRGPRPFTAHFPGAR